MKMQFLHFLKMPVLLVQFPLLNAQNSHSQGISLSLAKCGLPVCVHVVAENIVQFFFCLNYVQIQVVAAACFIAGPKLFRRASLT